MHLHLMSNPDWQRLIESPEKFLAPFTITPDALESLQGVAPHALAFHQRVNSTPPWGGYLVVRDQTLVGTCAFKGDPNAENTVELAYFTFARYEGQGYATWVAKELSRIALEHPGVRVIAHTLPENNASAAVLRKAGFTLQGEVNDPEDGLVWRWVQPTT